MNMLWEYKIVIVTVVLGFLIILGGSAAIWKIDRYWDREVSQCVRCRHVWCSVEKYCPHCQARGRLSTRGIIPPHRYPAHDWQGHMNTEPIPIIPKYKEYFDVSK